MLKLQSYKWISLFSLLACVSLSSCGMELGWPEPIAKDEQDSSDAPKLRIFVSKATTNGKIGSGSIAQADSLCEQDENKPSTGIYRALLADGTDRVALPFTQQKNWVFQPKRVYVQTDGKTVIGTTTSQAVLPMPLKAVISSENVTVWTGIGGGAWTTGLNCGAWAKDESTVNGVFGYANRINGESLAGGTSSCESARHIYCVEQPALDEDEE